MLIIYFPYPHFLQLTNSAKKRLLRTYVVSTFNKESNKKPVHRDNQKILGVSNFRFCDFLGVAWFEEGFCTWLPSGRVHFCLALLGRLPWCNYYPNHWGIQNNLKIHDGSSVSWLCSSSLKKFMARKFGLGFFGDFVWRHSNWAEIGPKFQLI